MSLQMENNLFNMKMAAKEMQRNSRKCEKEELNEKAKCKKAMEKGNYENAKIHAENAIRQKNQALNYLRMSARVEAVASRVQSAITTKKVTNSLGSVVKRMNSAMKNMSLEKISFVMDMFEKQFEDMDVQTSVMEKTMGSTTAMSVPQNDVSGLMHKIADEAGLGLNMELPNSDSFSVASITTGSVIDEQDDLSLRLAKLRQN